MHRPAPAFPAGPKRRTDDGEPPANAIAA